VSITIGFEYELMKSSRTCFRSIPESVESSTFVFNEDESCFAFVHATSVKQRRQVLNFMVSIKMAYNGRALRWRGSELLSPGYRSPLI